MKYEKYIDLIKRLESYAEKHPAAYQYRIGALALLGYAYLVGLVLICSTIPLILLAGVILNPGLTFRVLLGLFKLWWVLVPAAVVFFGFFAGALRSLTAKVPEPEGDEIAPAEAPQIFDVVRQTCRELEAREPEKILLNDDFNASVVTLPRFGIFGRKVYLNLGLPLMYALTPDQFRAVLTHEIGHISGKHGAFSKWAYQLHETWNRFIQSQESGQHKLSALYEKFVNWFFPYFSAYSFVLMRRHEREADDFAVQLVGARALGEALINLEIKGTHLSENFWREVFEENARQDQPPTELFSRMTLAFRSPDAGGGTEALRKFVGIKTDYSDTHPCLADRLKAIGYWSGGELPELPDASPAAGESAAEVFLGGLAEDYRRKFDREWQAKISENWKDNHEHLQNSRRRLEELNAREDLGVRELLEKAALVAERDGHREALPLVRRALEIEPDHAEANYVLGAMLLEQEDESGFAFLDRAMRLDRRFNIAASEVAFDYLRLRGRHDEAKPYVEVIENEREILRKAEQERSSADANENYEPHKLGAEEIAGLAKIVAAHPSVKAAYLAAKQVRHYPEIPFHVLFLEIKTPFLTFSASSHQQEVYEAVAAQLGDFDVQYVRCFGKNEGRFRKKIGKVENSKIFG